MSEKRFRINLNYNPDENWEPDWQEMTKADYIDEWDSDDATWQEMVKAGAVEEIRDPMTEGAKTVPPRMSDEWIADGNACHQDIMDLRDSLTEALKVAGEAANPITMQDVRLRAGEGTLSARDVLYAVNAILKRRGDALERIRNQNTSK